MQVYGLVLSFLLKLLMAEDIAKGWDKANNCKDIVYKLELVE